MCLSELCKSFTCCGLGLSYTDTCKGISKCCNKEDIDQPLTNAAVSELLNLISHWQCNKQRHYQPSVLTQAKFMMHGIIEATIFWCAISEIFTFIKICEMSSSNGRFSIMRGKWRKRKKKIRIPRTNPISFFFYSWNGCNHRKVLRRIWI